MTSGRHAPTSKEDVSRRPTFGEESSEIARRTGLVASTRPRVASTRALLLILLLLTPAILPTASALAGDVDVKLSLPMRARIDLTDREVLLPAPFVIVTEEGDPRLGTDIDILEEFRRYFRKIIRRDTDLKIAEVGRIQYPTYDIGLLARDQDFWRALGERAQADLIISGSLDFDVQDRSGYRTEEYTSPFDGRTYYRQVLVEQTGFEFDIVIYVFDGKTGEVLYSDNFKDFKSYEEDEADIRQGMFSNLYALEDRILGIFVQKEIEVTRTLLTK